MPQRQMDIRSYDDLAAWIEEGDWSVETGNSVVAEVHEEGTEVRLVRPAGDEVRIAEIWFEGNQIFVRTGEGGAEEEVEAESLDDLAEIIQNEIDGWQ